MKTETTVSPYAQIATADLIPSAWNPRKEIGESALKSLAASIASVGVLQPLVARTHPKKSGKFEILAGERRWRAAQLAKVATVPVNVRELDDKAAMELTVVENLLREDLHPLEEATGFQTLIEKGWDVASIASRFGKSPNWVAKRVALNKLSPLWRKRVQDPEDEASGVPLGVVEGLARLSADAQQALHDETKGWGKGRVPHCMRDVKDFNRHVAAEILRSLTQTPWSIDDATLHAKAGACSACPKRASQTPHLFDDLNEDAGKKAAGDRCLDAICYQEKLSRAMQAKVKAVESEHGAVLLFAAHGGLSRNDEETIAKTYGNRTIAMNWDFIVVKQGEKNARPAIAVNGDRPGRLVWLKPVPGTANTREARPKGVDGKPKPQTLKQRRDGLERRRQALVVEWIQNDLLQCAKGDDEFKIQHIFGRDMFTQLATLALSFGTSHQLGYSWHEKPADWAAVDARKDNAAPDIFASLYRSILAVIAERLKYSGPQDGIKPFHQAAARACELMGWKFEEYTDRAVEEIPEPKSWANLKADGTPKGATAPAKKHKEKADPGTPAKDTAAAKSKKTAKPVSGTCRVCGCTDDDCSECIAETGEPCVWMDEEQTLCSRCSDDEREEL